MDFKGVLAFQFVAFNGRDSQLHKLIQLIAARMLSICWRKRITKLLIIFNHLKHHFEVHTCRPPRRHSGKLILNECLSFDKFLSLLRPGMDQAPELELDAPYTLLAMGIVHLAFDLGYLSDAKVVLAEGDTHLGCALL
jgi:hypothetical protein